MSPRPDPKVPRRPGRQGQPRHGLSRPSPRRRRGRQADARHGHQGRSQERAAGVRRGRLRPRRAGHQEGPAAVVPRSLQDVRQHLRARHGPDRHGPGPVRRVGHRDERRRPNDERGGRPVRRTGRRDRQPPVLGRRRVLVLRRPRRDESGRVLQAGGGVAHPGRFRRARLRQARGADRAGLHRPAPQSVPLEPEAEVHVEQRRQAGAVAVPREARAGQVQAEAGHAHLELLLGGKLHLPGLPRLDGGGDEEWAHGGR
mmetsp:Transcript_26714/g.60330  ORF Transcript_26714/g.60330 Transcript_26714/m.60330 type:complete len:257 (-) Transcript_26714:167-937(-)